MLRKAEPGKRTAPARDPGNGGRLLHEIEALSKALSLTKNPPPPPKSLPPDHHHRSFSAGKSRFPEPRSKPRAPRKDPPPPPPHKDKKSSSSSSSSSSIWNWRPLRALSHIRHRRFDCRFTLHVHSVDCLPSNFNNDSLCVHWKRNMAEVGVRTRPARVFQGVAEFEETLAHRCPVYGSRGGGPNHSAKYEARQFVLYVAVVGLPEVDFGKHRVDLTRLLPLTLEELEEESSGKWSTSFKLSGKGRGAMLNVSFGFSVTGGGDLAESGSNKKVSEFLAVEADRAADRVEPQNSLRRVGSVPGPHHFPRDRPRLSSRSVEDVKVLHEVLPNSRLEPIGSVDVDRLLVYKKCDEGELDAMADGSKPEFEVFSQQDELLDLKSQPVSEPVKRDGEEEFDNPEFTVIERGIEIATKDEVKGDGVENDELEGVDEGRGDGSGKACVKPDPVGRELSVCDPDPKENSFPADESVVGELDSAFRSLSNLESLGLESLEAEDGTPQRLNYVEVKSNYKMGKMCKSLSLDDATESIASEFLSMLGIEHSPIGLSSDSDPESPRERLWKQFKKDSLSTRENIFDLGTEKGTGLDRGEFSEDFDLASIVNAAETEHQKVMQAMKSKTRAKMLEDAEAEALMCEWGLNEKAFHSSPPGSRSGFGSPIDLPHEEPLDLPPLGDGLGPFVQTKDGGFLRSMNTSLFRNAKNTGSLIMQVSSPVVVPAEMGSGIMEILQRLASIGIEKLSMQASNLMPLEDITGKTMQQVAWEAVPALEACKRQDLLQHLKPEGESRLGQNAAGRRNRGKGLNLSSSRSGEASSEYVSLEDLAPLAMEKIEALSIEGLRVQSGMSDEDAPSNISPQSIGEISALEGKVAKNSRSFGLEGAAGLQLLDVKDSGDDVDGLMGLSITLDEWMRLDSGIIDEEDQISDRTSKILAAHHASSADLVRGGWKGDGRGAKNSGGRWGLLGSNFTVALMVQLRDPLRNYEPVGTPMLALIQVERVFIPPKPKIYSTVSEKGNSEQDEEPETEPKPVTKEEKKEEVEEVIPQFKITEVHVAGLKTDSCKKKIWGNPMQQQSGSRWLLASGMGKKNKHPFMKSKAVTKPSQVTTTVQPGDTLWSISSRVHGTGTKWKELAVLNPHIRNPDVILPNETIRLR